MTEETKGQEPIEPTESVEAQAVTPPAAEPAAADSVDALPDWAQKLVKDLRAENAKHRKAKTQAEKEAEALARQQAEEQGQFKELYEKTMTELEQAKQSAQAAELARLKATVAHEMSLPAPLVDRLQGDTLEELKADAQVLLDAMPKPQMATKTDSAAGVNGKQPTPQRSDDEIREMAARLGVSFEHLKNQFVKE